MQSRNSFESSLILFFAVSFCVFSCPDSARALVNDTASPETAEAAVQITSIRRGREADVEPENADYIPAIWLRDTIIVTVTDADRLLEAAPVDLYFNGSRVPVSSPLKVNSNQLEFKIDNAGDGAEKQFFARIFSEPWVYEKTVEVTVGNAMGEFKQAVPKPLTLRVVHLRHFVIWVVAMIFLVGVTWVLGKRTNLLREWGEQQSESGRPNRYSLGRFQLAFWFVLVVAAFSFIYLNVDKTMPIPMSMVVLMAISAATAMGVAMIESAEKTDTVGQLKKLSVDLAVNETMLEALQQSNPGTEAGKISQVLDVARSQAEIEQARLEIAALTTARFASPTKGLIHDLLGAGKGYSLHRMQLIVWIIALAVVFLSQLMKELTMPRFEETLLALLGISCVIYLGFRMYEKK